MNYSIAESYTLPSKGKVYDKDVNPEIKLRSMTTLEEMKRLSKSDRPYKNMSEIIDDCLVENPGISAYDMCIGDYQFLLHKLRIVTYGPEYNLASVCPYCGAKETGTVNLENLAVLEYSDNISNLIEFILPKSEKVVKLKIQTPRILDDITVKAKEANRKSKSSGDFSYLITLESLIQEVDGKKLNPLERENFVRTLDMMDANTILQYAEKLNNSIGLDTKIETDCENCGLTYKNSFRITSEFFGPRINI